jgi:hypothetical protein
MVICLVLLLLIVGGCIAAFAVFTKNSGGGGPAIGIAVGCGVLVMLGLMFMGAGFFLLGNPAAVQPAQVVLESVQITRPRSTPSITSIVRKSEQKAAQPGVAVRLLLKATEAGVLELTVENLTSGPVSPLTLRGNSPAWFLVHAAKGTKSEIEEWDAPNRLVTPGESQVYKISDPLDELGLVEGDKVLVSFEQSQDNVPLSIKSNAVKPK